MTTPSCMKIAAMDDMKAKLTNALNLQPLGAIAMADLARHYRQINKEKLDFKTLGYDSLQTLLEAMPDTVQVKYDKKSSDYRVFLVHYEVDKAIEKEIDNQDQRGSSLDESYSTRKYDQNGDWRRESFADETGTSHEKPANSLRQKPIPTAFRGQNDWDLYLKNIPDGTKESDLMDEFKPFECTRVRIKKRENETLFGFATFRDYSKAEEAYVTLDGMEFRGRRLVIQFAKSSIASEDEVRKRLQKTQFTTEVTSSRHRNVSSDEHRTSPTQTDNTHWRKAKDQLDSRCHYSSRMDDSSRLPWQLFSAPGYRATEDERSRRREGGTAPTLVHDIMASYTHQKEVANGGTSSINGEYSCGRVENKRSVQSRSSRTVPVFTDVEADAADDSKEDAEAISNETTIKRYANKTVTCSPGSDLDWVRHARLAKLCSTQSNGITYPARTVPILDDAKFGGRQSNSNGAHETLDKGRDESYGSEERLNSVECEKRTERLDSPVSIGSVAPDQLDTNLNCTTKVRSVGSQEIRSRNEIRGRMPEGWTLKRNSEVDRNKDTRGGSNKNMREFLDINRMSEISLSKTLNESSISSDDNVVGLQTEAVRAEVDSGLKIIDGGHVLLTENCPLKSGEREETTSTRSHVFITASDIAPKWTIVYVRDDEVLIRNMLRWTSIYSRNVLHLGKIKYQCRPLIQLRNPSLREFPKLSSDITNSSLLEFTELSPNISNLLTSRTEISSGESLDQVDAIDPSISNTSMARANPALGRCCETIPNTMDFQFLHNMLKETLLTRCFLTQDDLPDVLDLIVIHVSNSNHFWGSVINPGPLMDEYEELFEMMNDIAVKAKPEFRLDKATADAKRAGVMYQETDWCRVWIGSEVRNSEVEVFYIDYGNSEFRSTEDLWVLPRKVWDLRPMVLPFHLTGSLTKKSLFEMINTKITVKLVRSHGAPLDFVVAVRPYEELD